jgi:hypothetical protein
MLAGAIVRTVAPADVALRSSHRAVLDKGHQSNRTRGPAAVTSAFGHKQKFDELFAGAYNIAHPVI